MIAPWDPGKNLINQLGKQVCEIWGPETVQEELGRRKQPTSVINQISNVKYDI